ncbi:hypothetical protein L7F22_065719 [Adiantum nelumboides]|nr:hypothetical protein [Adiantum nelumboides]
MHRDLKPRNVLLRYFTEQDLGCNRFQVKLADFGLAKLYSLAQDGVEVNPACVGTPCYMAPELRGNAQTKVTYEEKMDVFSYGTTCFNILIGNPDAMAFAGSRDGFYKAVKTGQWKQWVQGFDRNLSFMKKLVARCWETDPTMRPTFATICLLLQHRLRCLFLLGKGVGHLFSGHHHEQLQALARQLNQYSKKIYWKILKRAMKL